MYSCSCPLVSVNNILKPHTDLESTSGPPIIRLSYYPLLLNPNKSQWHRYLYKRRLNLLLHAENLTTLL